MTVSGVWLLKARAGPAPRAPPTVKVPWRRMSVKLCPPESCRLRAPVPRAHAGVQLRRSGPSSHRLSAASGPRRLLPCLRLSFLFSALIFFAAVVVVVVFIWIPNSCRGIFSVFSPSLLLFLPKTSSNGSRRWQILFSPEAWGSQCGAVGQHG